MLIWQHLRPTQNAAEKETANKKKTLIPFHIIDEVDSYENLWTLFEWYFVRKLSV